MGTTKSNELAELYDVLSVVYDALPTGTCPEWGDALHSVLYGGELLADDADCYGKQQNIRNNHKQSELRRWYGNGERITEFSTIEVSEPRPQDQKYVPSGAVVPVTPKSGRPLPVKVTDETIDEALLLLAEFPAEPAADSPGSGQSVLLDPSRLAEATLNTDTPGTHTETTLLFVSDTHLGYEFRSETNRGDKVSWIDEIETVETMIKIIVLAEERDVDAIIHTGDILDHEVPSGYLDEVDPQIGLLEHWEIPVYCIIGTHDHNAYEPSHPDAANGIAWLKSQIRSGPFRELSTEPKQIPERPVAVYGISAGGVGIDDVGTYKSRGWSPSDVSFTSSDASVNILCLHDSITPFREEDADVDIDRLFALSDVEFDCVLVGDEHHPKGYDFDDGYEFTALDGTPILYTGPAIRISPAYQDHSAMVTEVTISGTDIDWTRIQL